MKPNRFDDLQTLCDWLESKITALESRQIRQGGVLHEEQEQTRKDLLRLWRGYFLLALVVALLLADRLWP